jgi:hypothetical protein
MKTKNTEGSANPKIQHASGKDDVAKSPAMHSAGETTSACTPLVSGAAIHPEIIARASECKAPVKITALGVALDSVPTYYDGCEKDRFPLGHYCNMNRCHSMRVEDIDRSDHLLPAMEPGMHRGMWGASFSCITEHKGGDGIVFTITCDEKLFALLGVATTEESSSLVWDWLKTQYEVLRRVSLEVTCRPKTGDLELRRRGIIGDTYIECAAPAKPARCPWFSYIANDDRFHEHLLYYPEDTLMLGSLAYRWWFEWQAARRREEQACQFESAA